MATVNSQFDMNLQEVVTENRFEGMWRLLRGYRWIYTGAILGVGISAVARTGTYLLLGYFVDEVLVNENSQFTVFQIGLAFIGLSLIMGGFAFASGALAGRTAEGIAKRVRDYVFDHIQHLTFTYHDQTNTGELVQRSTSDIDAIRRFYADQAIGIGRISLLFLVNFAALLWLDWRLARMDLEPDDREMTRATSLADEPRLRFNLPAHREATRPSICLGEVDPRFLEPRVGKHEGRIERLPDQGVDFPKDLQSLWVVMLKATEVRSPDCAGGLQIPFPLKLDELLG